MSVFLGFVIVGLVTGSIYALIATGLVVTYTTTGIFNFGHGAVAMASAFMFWQLWQGWHINVVLSVALMLLVIAPLFGLIIERVLMRPLRGAPVDVSVVITLGLLLLLVGVANVAWNPQTPRSLPEFFGGRGFGVAGNIVSYHELITVISLVVAAFALRVLFTQTRLGIAMRAVVDNPDLLAMAGGRPERVQQLAWAMSCSLAALAGMLLAPIQHLNILNLTLLVVDGYAAAIIGRLRNLPLAIGGALTIAIGQNLALGYLPTSGFVSQIQNILPIGILFIALIVLPQDRLRTASLGGAIAPRVAGLGSSIFGGVAVIAVAVVLSRTLSVPHLQTGTEGFALALVLLSLVLVTGYGGMVSLCQIAFLGLGAYAMSHLGHGGSLLGVVAAVVLSGGVGALVALPTLRLRGLYLALATFAFASVMEVAVFGQLIGSGGAISVAKVKIPGLSTQSDSGFFVFSSVVFVLCAIGVLTLRRGPFGRKLVATNDSPAACATLGVSVNATKLITFTVAASLAGLAGVIYGGNQGQVSTQSDLAALLSLIVLLLARVGGINTVTGALFGAFTYALYPVLNSHLPAKYAAAQYILTGLAAVSVGRDPNGFGGRIASLAEIFRSSRPSHPSAKPGAQPVANANTPAAVFIAEEGETVVGAH